MKEKILLGLGAFCIFLAFLPACILVWLSIPYYLITWQKEKLSQTFNAMNRMVSTLFGGDGTRSTSHTSGVKLIFNEADWRHKTLCSILDTFDKNHCIKEAQDDPRVKEAKANGDLR